VRLEQHPQAFAAAGIIIKYYDIGHNANFIRQITEAQCRKSITNYSDRDLYFDSGFGELCKRLVFICKMHQTIGSRIFVRYSIEYQFYRKDI